MLYLGSWGTVTETFPDEIEIIFDLIGIPIGQITHTFEDVSFFLPVGVRGNDRAESWIDLRADSSAAAGRCLVESPHAIVGPGVDDLGDPEKKITGRIKNLLTAEFRYDVDPSRNLKQVLGDLLTDGGDSTDPTIFNRFVIPADETRSNGLAARFRKQRSGPPRNESALKEIRRQLGGSR